MGLKRSEYFARVAAIPEIGTVGIEKLQSSSVGVVGVGGIGAAAAEYLARSGVGYLRLIDQDIVEPSNLHRLPGTNEKHLYHPKAEVVAEICSKSHPWIRIEPFADTIRSDNSDDLLKGVDLVVDGLDNFRTRYILNQYSYKTGIPYLFASAISNQGHASLFSPPITPCLSCIMPNLIDRPQESCEVLGANPSAVGFLGAILASEAVKFLLGHETRLNGHLLTVDLIGPEFIISDIQKRETCDLCGPLALHDQVQTRAPSWLCGQKTANVLPSRGYNLALGEISRSLPMETILANTETVLVFQRDSHIVSLFRTGRILVEGVEDEESALKIAVELWQKFLPSETYSQAGVSSVS